MKKQILATLLAITIGCTLSGCGANSSSAQSDHSEATSQVQENSSSDTIDVSSSISETPTETVEITNDNIYDGNVLINKFFNRFNMVNSDVSITQDNIEDGSNVKTNCNVNIDGTYANIAENSGTFDVLIYCDKCHSEDAMVKMLYAYTRAFYPLVTDNELNEMYQPVQQVSNTIHKGLAEIDNVNFTYTPEDIVHDNARTLDINMASINLQEDEIEVYVE